MQRMHGFGVKRELESEREDEGPWKKAHMDSEHSGSSSFPSTLISAWSEDPIVNTRLIWNIPAFRSVSARDCRLISPSVSDEEGKRWRVYLKFEADQTYGIYLQCLSPPVRASFCVGVRARGETHCVDEDSDDHDGTEFSVENSMDWGNEGLELSKLHKYLLPDGALHFSILISYTGKKRSHTIGHLDLSSALESTENSDFVLEAEGERIPVHRLVLAAASDVFRVMLQTKMKESSSGVLKIPNASSKAVKAMIHFVYKGKAPRDIKGIEEELCSLADQYNLPLLMADLDGLLIRKLKKHNLFQMMTLAESFPLPLLKSGCRGELVVGQRERSLSRDSWEALKKDNPYLAIKILEDTEALAFKD